MAEIGKVNGYHDCNGVVHRTMKEAVEATRVTKIRVALRELCGSMSDNGVQLPRSEDELAELLFDHRDQIQNAFQQTVSKRAKKGDKKVQPTRLAGSTPAEATKRIVPFDAAKPVPPAVAKTVPTPAAGDVEIDGTIVTAAQLAEDRKTRRPTEAEAQSASVESRRVRSASSIRESGIEFLDVEDDASGLADVDTSGADASVSAL